MTTDKKDFDAAASTWDENPARVKLAGEVAEAIIRRVSPNRAMNAADFGCGTGLLSLKLQPLVASITGIDSSPGMLEILRAKVDIGKLTNVRTQLVDVEKGEVLAGSYDLITSCMTLHHIADPKALLGHLSSALAPGGILAVADLDPDGGLFHDDNTGVHHFGFDRGMVRAMFAGAGLLDIEDGTATELVKPAAGGTKRNFSVFLVSGRKG
ncbi:MAG: class I SAM-dependent methyltransferase [Desulforhopalus sp.]|nr:class I SAM-dependent methyltransferase [Desulforhopalus sp.]